jgi:hypothetical protein
MEGSFCISQPQGFDGLDELAAELGVEEGGANSLIVEGRSGKRYDLVALLSAHLREMRERSTTS